MSLISQLSTSVSYVASADGVKSALQMGGSRALGILCNTSPSKDTMASGRSHNHSCGLFRSVELDSSDTNSVDNSFLVR